MRKLGMMASVVATVALAVSGPLGAQGKPKDLIWTHAFDLAARKYGESDFSKDTQKFGVEVFKDNNNGLGLYLSQAGGVGLAGGFEALTGAIKDSKGPEWLTGLDLPARKAGEKEFSKDTKVHSMEVFRDPNSSNWVYITEKGWLAVCSAKGGESGASKTPKFSHSVDLAVRKGGVKDWAQATKYGIEVYKDQGTGNLIYISDIGAIAVIPEPPGTPAVEKGKPPEWLHGLDLACRKFDEPNFTKDTRRYGIEVFRDMNNGNLIFISETGHLAVAAGPKELKAPTPNVKQPVWTHGLNVRCRQTGEKEFSTKTRTFGGEVFQDENVGAVLYIFETGTLAAARK